MQPGAAAEMNSALELLEKTPGVLKALLDGVPRDVLDWKPGPERWSICEVVAHLGNIEMLYVERARRILAEDNPALQKFVPGGPLPGGPSADALERLAHFSALRSELLGVLKNAPASAGLRIGTHEELGTLTLAHLLNELANHDLGHLRQIAELYRARAFYPNAGPFQRYSSPQP